MVRKNITLVLAMVALAGLSGCATTADIDALRSEVKQANETAQSAAAKVDAASEKADAASREAAAAAQVAAEAKTMAEESNARIDRMFKKSMYK